MRIIPLLLILIFTSCSTMKIKRMYNKEIKNQDKEYLNSVNNIISKTNPSDTSYIRYALENLRLDHEWIINDLEYRKSKIKKLTRKEKKSILSEKVIKLPKLDSDGDGVADFFDDDTLYIVEERLLEYTVSKSISVSPSKINNKIINKKNNLDIIDKTTEKLDNSSKGTIAYSVPNEMEVGKQYVIKLRVTKEKGKEVNRTLVLGDRDISISDIDVNSRVTIENIRVEKRMTAQLVSTDDAFKVTPQNTDRQLIEDDEYTEWGWLVKPLKSGNSYLKLVIKIRIDSDGETTYKDIVVFDKNIKVKSNIKYGVKSWFSEYWQWLMSTIIIPLVIFFYKSRKKKDGKEDKI